MAEESEVKSWLTEIFASKHLENLSVNMVGTSEKGDGYLGDIVFVDASGTKDGVPQQYHLVLKCTKRNEAAQNNVRLTVPFKNEIYFYSKIFPTIVEFQRENGVTLPFKNVPKFHGTFVQDKMNVIALENLTKNGFDLWPRRKPMMRKHLDLVMEAYGKYHACSVALKYKHPKVFDEIVAILEENMKVYSRSSNSSMFSSGIEEVAELFEDELDSDTLVNWRKLSTLAKDIFENSAQAKHKVILHGDCWNNNFMFKCDNTDKMQPSEVVLLDWQMPRYFTPMFDLSYFLFTCVSEKDINSFNEIISGYYKHFSNHLHQFELEPQEVYPYDEFLDDWKKYHKCGAILSTLILKICSTDKEDVVDITEAAGVEGDFVDSLNKKVDDKYKVAYKNRMRCIVKYIVENK